MFLYKQHIMDWLVTTGQVSNRVGGGELRDITIPHDCEYEIFVDPHMSSV
jgi:hypothetical protein